MRYSKNYKKLRQQTYTTVRRYPKGKVGKTQKEEYPAGYHFSKIVGLERKTINSMSTEFLLKDTECKTREEAVEYIQSFYVKPIDLEREKLYVYKMFRIN